MNRYQPNAPRPLLGLAALALSVLTLSIAVLAPSNAERIDTAAHVTEAVRIEPARIEVIGSRATVMADDRAAQRPAS